MKNGPPASEAKLSAGNHGAVSARMLAVLFAISLAVRISFWLPVAFTPTPPFGDELAYLHRAVGFENIIKHAWPSVLHPTLSLAEASDAAYLQGYWPPLHPLVLGIVFAIFGNNIAVARLVSLVLSAATTPLVYLLTARFISKRAASWASAIHICYPSFVAYAHFLWSENLFMLLVLVAVYSLLLLSEARSVRGMLILSILSGVLMGLAGLTRAALLPWLVVIPFWLIVYVRGLGWKLVSPLLLLASFVITVLPWEVVMYERERSLMPLVASGGLALYWGNNPYGPFEAFVERETEEEEFQRFMADIAEYSRSSSIHPSAAGRALAMVNLKADFGIFLKRAFDRLRALFVPDSFILRHVSLAIYPPMPQWAAGTIFAMAGLSFFCLAGLAAFGFLHPGSSAAHRLLVLLMIAGGALAPLMTRGQSRYALPFIVLLLPFAGHAASSLSAKPKASRSFAFSVAAVVGLLSVLNVFTRPNLIGLGCWNTSYYSPLFQRADRIFGTRTPFADYLVLRVREPNAPAEVNVALRGEGYIFWPSKTPQCEWSPSPETPQVRLRVDSATAEAPPQIELVLKSSGQPALISPISRDSWRRWQPTGLDGIEYMWTGGLGDPRTPEEVTSAWRIS